MAAGDLGRWGAQRLRLIKIIAGENQCLSCALDEGSFRQLFHGGWLVGGPLDGWEV